MSAERSTFTRRLQDVPAVRNACEGTFRAVTGLRNSTPLRLPSRLTGQQILEVVRLYFSSL